MCIGIGFDLVTTVLVSTVSCLFSTPRTLLSQLLSVMFSATSRLYSVQRYCFAVACTGNHLQLHCC